MDKINEFLRWNSGFVLMIRSSLGVMEATVGFPGQIAVVSGMGATPQEAIDRLGKALEDHD